MPPEDNSKLFISEYTTEFVDRWDELIDWEKRQESEGGFFEKILSDNQAKTVLDIACGTGYHTVNLSKIGFTVTGSDGSANMVRKARENAAKFGLVGTRLLEAQWTSLSDVFQDEKFDAIVCLGNAFTHLFNDDERRKALTEIYGLLNDGGVAVLDHRNYDTMLDKGFSSKHLYYYLGETVDARPEIVTEEIVRLQYSYADGAVHHLTVCPIRQEHLTDLLTGAGFQSVERYGDFEAGYDFYDPDFIIQVAKK
jgi:ubiquinone/menaquinone biosynthesis C-methylase UbiE